MATYHTMSSAIFGVILLAVLTTAQTSTRQDFRKFESTDNKPSIRSAGRHHVVQDANERGENASHSTLSLTQSHRPSVAHHNIVAFGYLQNGLVTSANIGLLRTERGEMHVTLDDELADTYVVNNTLTWQKNHNGTMVAGQLHMDHGIHPTRAYIRVGKEPLKSIAPDQMSIQIKRFDFTVEGYALPASCPYSPYPNTSYYDNAKMCDADGSWYCCASPECNQTRQCDTDDDLSKSTCACPIVRPELFPAIEMGLTRTGPNQMWLVPDNRLSPAKGTGANLPFARNLTSVYMHYTHMTGDSSPVEVNLDPSIAAAGLSTWRVAEFNFTDGTLEKLSGLAYPYNRGGDLYMGPAMKIESIPTTAFDSSRRTPNGDSLAAGFQQAYPYENLSSSATATFTLGATRRAPPADLLSKLHPNDVSKGVTGLYSVEDLFKNMPLQVSVAQLHEEILTKIEHLSAWYVHKTGNRTCNDDNQCVSFLDMMGYQHPPSVGPDGELTLDMVNLVWNCKYNERTRLVDCPHKKQKTDMEAVKMASFLIDYAKYTIYQALSSHNMFSEKVKLLQKNGNLPSNLEQRLLFYWQGTGATSMSNNDGYDLLNARLRTLTYRWLNPKIEEYMAYWDERLGECNPPNTPASCWARALFNYSILDSNLEYISHHSDWNALTNALVTVMDCLDESPTFVAKNGPYDRNISHGAAFIESMLFMHLQDSWSMPNNATTVAQFMLYYWSHLIDAFENCTETHPDPRTRNDCDYGNFTSMPEDMWNHSMKDYYALKEKLGLNCKGSDCVSVMMSHPLVDATVNLFGATLSSSARSLYGALSGLGVGSGGIFHFDPYLYMVHDIWRPWEFRPEELELVLVANKWLQHIVPVALIIFQLGANWDDWFDLAKWKDGTNEVALAMTVNSGLQLLKTFKGAKFLASVTEASQASQRAAWDYVSSFPEYPDPFSHDAMEFFAKDGNRWSRTAHETAERVKVNARDLAFPNQVVEEVEGPSLQIAHSTMSRYNKAQAWAANTYDANIIYSGYLREGPEAVGSLAHPSATTAVIRTSASLLEEEKEDVVVMQQAAERTGQYQLAESIGNRVNLYDDPLVSAFKSLRVLGAILHVADVAASGYMVYLSYTTWKHDEDAGQPKGVRDWDTVAFAADIVFAAYSTISAGVYGYGLFVGAEVLGSMLSLSGVTACLPVVGIFLLAGIGIAAAIIAAKKREPPKTVYAVFLERWAVDMFSLEEPSAEWVHKHGVMDAWVKEIGNVTST